MCHTSQLWHISFYSWTESCHLYFFLDSDIFLVVGHVLTTIRLNFPQPLSVNPLLLQLTRHFLSSSSPLIVGDKNVSRQLGFFLGELTLEVLKDGDNSPERVLHNDCHERGMGGKTLHKVSISKLHYYETWQKNMKVSGRGCTPQGRRNKYLQQTYWLPDNALLPNCHHSGYPHFSVYEDYFEWFSFQYCSILRMTWVLLEPAENTRVERLETVFVWQ